MVNFNAGEHLAACCASLRAGGAAKVVVVDNSSSDDSVAALARREPQVEVVHTGSNRGFGTAANLGVNRTTTDLVLVLNPDTVVNPGAIDEMARALRADPGLAAVGPRIDNPDGSRYPSARRFPSIADSAGHGFVGLFRADNPFTRRYRMSEADPDIAAEVDWVSGAAMMLRREAFYQVGGFDEAYFMYVEDVDLCWRLGSAGWRIGYEPAARVTHEVGVSSRQAPYRMIVEHHRSLMRFAYRTTTGPARAALPVVAAGLVARTGLACARHAAEGRRKR